MKKVTENFVFLEYFSYLCTIKSFNQDICVQYGSVNYISM